MKTKTTGLKISRLAKLANVPINSEEEKLYESQLSKILEYVDLIESVNLITTQPTYNVSAGKNITRHDSVSKSITHEKALQNGKGNEGYFFTEGVFTEN